MVIGMQIKEEIQLYIISITIFGQKDQNGLDYVLYNLFLSD